MNTGAPEPPLPAPNDFSSASERLGQLREAIRMSPAQKLDTLRKSGNQRTPQYDAVVKILSGELTEAISFLKELEARRPGDYLTAANLGTAYELNGQLEEAVYWIGEGIRRNPLSHAGTEWLHVRILEMKQQLRSDPDRLTNTHIIDEEESQKARDALFYQLRERLVFVKPRDPVVGDLLYSLAVEEQKTEMYRNAVELFLLAGKYGYVRQEELRDALDVARDQLQYQNWRRTLNALRIGGLIFVSAGALFILIWLGSKVQQRLLIRA